jgi:hypothetical protein
MKEDRISKNINALKPKGKRCMKGPAHDRYSK